MGFPMSVNFGDVMVGSLGVSSHIALRARATPCTQFMIASDLTNSTHDVLGSSCVGDACRDFGMCALGIDTTLDDRAAAEIPINGRLTLSMHAGTSV